MRGEGEASSDDVFVETGMGLADRRGRQGIRVILHHFLRPALEFEAVPAFVEDGEGGGTPILFVIMRGDAGIKMPREVGEGVLGFADAAPAHVVML